MFLAAVEDVLRCAVDPARARKAPPAL